MALTKDHNITPMLFLKLQRRVRQEPYKSEIPIGGGTTNVGVFIYPLREIIIIRVNSGVSVGGARATVLDLGAPVALRDRGIGRDHSVGAM